MVTTCHSPLVYPECNRRERVAVKKKTDTFNSLKSESTSVPMRSAIPVVIRSPRATFEVPSSATHPALSFEHKSLSISSTIPRISQETHHPETQIQGYPWMTQKAPMYWTGPELIWLHQSPDRPHIQIHLELSKFFIRSQLFSENFKLFRPRCHYLFSTDNLAYMPHHFKRCR